jgi:hypothetical protein
MKLFDVSRLENAEETFHVSVELSNIVQIQLSNYRNVSDKLNVSA